jgi:hypothetical protein
MFINRLCERRQSVGSRTTAARCVRSDVVVGLPVLPVTGDEVIVALQRAGFRHADGAGGEAILMVKGYRTVVVPRVGALGPAELRLVLHDAGVSYSEFLESFSVRAPDPLGGARSDESQVRLRRRA